MYDFVMPDLVIHFLQLTFDDSRNHSVLKLLTGLANAALMAVYPTVNHAITNEQIIVAIKMPAPKLIR